MLAAMKRFVWAALFLASCARVGCPTSPTPAPVASPAVPVGTVTLDQKFEREPIVPNADRRKYMRCGEAIEAVDGCMVRVPGGRFFRGAQHVDPIAKNYDKDAADDEGPVREVTLTPFWIHKLEVSAGEFIECVTQGGCKAADVDRSGGLFTGAGQYDHPINGVTWQGAADYCRWIEGRLPTEAEYEFVARGTDGRRFPWGDEPPSCPKTIMNNGCGAGGTSLRDFTGGGAVLFGALALAGGVWEWTGDWYSADAYRTGGTTDPRGPSTGLQRVIRGGGWMSTDAVELRSAYRAQLAPDSRMPDVGFRCVRSEAN